MPESLQYIVKTLPTYCLNFSNILSKPLQCIALIPPIYCLYPSDKLLVSCIPPLNYLNPSNIFPGSLPYISWIPPIYFLDPSHIFPGSLSYISWIPPIYFFNPSKILSEFPLNTALIQFLWYDTQISQKNCLGPLNMLPGFLKILPESNQNNVWIPLI